MLIDVGDLAQNVWLNMCFFSIMFFTIASIIPWRILGAARIGRLSRWFVLPVFTLAVIYEAMMPSRFDIRVDLFLLLPMYLVVLVSSLVRWWLSRAT